MQFKIMNIKESISDYLKIGELKDNLMQVIEAKIDLKKLDIQEKIEDKIAPLITNLIIGVFVFIAFVMLNIILAVLLNGALESTWIGYAIVFLIYSLLALLIYVNREKVEVSIKNKISEEIDKAF